jgi:hypothetical protein
MKYIEVYLQVLVPMEKKVVVEVPNEFDDWGNAKIRCFLHRIFAEDAAVSSYEGDGYATTSGDPEEGKHTFMSLRGEHAPRFTVSKKGKNGYDVAVCICHDKE